MDFGKIRLWKCGLNPPECEQGKVAGCEHGNETLVPLKWRNLPD